MNICIECKWSKIKEAQTCFLFHIPAIMFCCHKESRDIVDGTPFTCVEARRFGSPCGKEGDLWEARDVVKE